MVLGRPRCPTTISMVLPTRGLRSLRAIRDTWSTPCRGRAGSSTCPSTSTTSHRRRRPVGARRTRLRARRVPVSVYALPLSSLCPIFTAPVSSACTLSPLLPPLLLLSFTDSNFSSESSHGIHVLYPICTILHHGAHVFWTVFLLLTSFIAAAAPPFVLL
ncbi:hypothetical protein HYPSUDRAFT_288483 [Hypholoma sublateritium FD-334 SS-4]|uniref:Uncharacterized protein n=1 Tax=Hypholoma sublateritium (strain FD-334 SS-4) TaxID=945553 RepID=A0A0D2M0A9_HYPSF|nr:hypothetical protein HYPSUDRAFT_288483 [Hypholoma sublateritium FD-334 SS-4]